MLETGFIAFRLMPFHRNVGKRLTKSPKLYFYDSGLLCHLLGIRTAEELRLHPLRGSIFESWVISEIVKARVHRGLSADLFFYRDFRGVEVDVVLASGLRHVAVEIKSSQTFTPAFLASLHAFAAVTQAGARPASQLEQVVVYGGDAAQRRTDAEVLPWSSIDKYDWAGSRLAAPPRTRRAARR